MRAVPLVLLLATSAAAAQQSIPPQWYDDGTFLCSAYKVDVTGASLTCSGGTVTIPISSTPSYPLLAPNGAANAPSYSFTNDTDTGMYLVNASPGSLGFSVASSGILTLTSAAMTLQGLFTQSSGAISLIPTGTTKIVSTGDNLLVDATATLNLGTSTATAVNLSRTGVTTQILGTPVVTSSLDRIAAGTLSLGATTANAVTIGGSGINTTFGGAGLFGGIVDRSTAAALSVGTVNATAVNIATTSTSTTIQGGQRCKRVTVADTTYTTDAAADYLIAYTSLSATRVVTGTTGGSATQPIRIVIKDESGSASGTVKINFDPSSGNIDGAANKDVIVTAYGFVGLYCNGTNWFTE